jgi:glycerophosphoryl diester phosphodiesterase
MLKIAHRGASGQEPENTLRSFRKAIALNADMIELDVRLSKDGEVIVFHDANFRRVAKKRGKVKDLSLKEIKSYNVCGEKVPTLREVLDLCSGKIKLNIELKGRDTAEGVAKLIREFVDKGKYLLEDFLVCSFNLTELKKFRDLMPKTRVGVLYDKKPKSVIKTAQKLGAYSINLSSRQFTKKRLERAHKEKMKVYVWTIDTEKGIKKFKKLGVDGIISNFPELI